MSKMKTEFELLDQMESEVGTITIVTDYGPTNTCILVDVKGQRCWIREEDTERFAVNILKALNSKKLKTIVYDR